MISLGELDLQTSRFSGNDSLAERLDHMFRERLCRLVEREMNARYRCREDAEDVVQSVFRTFFCQAASGKFEFHHQGALWNLAAEVGSAQNFETHPISTGAIPRSQARMPFARGLSGRRPDGRAGLHVGRCTGGSLERAGTAGTGTVRPATAWLLDRRDLRDCLAWTGATLSPDPSTAIAGRIGEPNCQPAGVRPGSRPVSVKTDPGTVMQVARRRNAMK
jgi:hypothetical protein